MADSVSNEMIARLAEQDVNVGISPQQLAILRSDEMLDQWREVLVKLKRDYQITGTSLKSEMALKHEEFRAKGESGKGLWFRYKAEKSAEFVRLMSVLAKIDTRLGEINPLIKQKHREQSEEQALIDKQKYFRLKYDIESSLTPEVKYLLRVIDRLAGAITPLSSLDYMLTTDARDDTHIAAYKAVRLKVADIREARAAWLEAQTVIGSLPKSEAK